MYKIQCYLLAFMLLSVHFAFSQQHPGRSPFQTDRQLTFTDHLLTDRVELSPKPTYSVLIEGQKVSLPSPILFQTQLLQP